MLLPLYICSMLIRYSFYSLLALLLLGCTPDPEASLSQSRTLVQEGKHAEAIQKLDALLAQEPEMAAAYNLRGVAYLESGNAQDAISDFSQAVRYQPDDYKYWFNRANARFNARELAEALQDYNEAIRLEPNVADIYLNRAATLFDMQNAQAAQQDISVALEKSPQDPLVQFNAGKLYFALDSMNLARQHLTEAIRLDKRKAEAFYLLGNVMQQQGQQQEACTLFKQAAQLGSEAAKEAAQNCSRG